MLNKLLKKYTKHKLKKPENPRVKQDINKRSVIIHHYCPHTYNAGDHFVIRSIRNHIKNRIPEAVFLPKPCAVNRGWGKPARLTGPNIDFSNDYADAVIVGGSDQYNGWSLRIREDEIDHLLPPLYLIGLGISSKDLHSPPNIPEDKYLDDIRSANEAAAYSSVRDDITYKFLKSLKVKKHVMTGCPAMYLFNEKFSMKDDGYVILTFPFPVIRSNNGEVYSGLLKLTGDLIKDLKKRGRNVLLACHDDRDLQPAQELFPGERFFFSNYPEDYYDIYRNAAYVIGTRLHATILSAGMGIPFVNINLDLRGKGFSDTFKLDKWNINVNDPNIGQKIIERIDILEAGDLKAFGRFYKEKEKHRKIFEKFMDNVAEDIIKKVK